MFLLVVLSRLVELLLMAECAESPPSEMEYGALVRVAVSLRDVA